MLFGCQMVCDDRSSEQNRPSISDKSEAEINIEFVLDKIYEFSDMQRNFIIAKRKFKTGANVDAIVETIGIDSQI